MDESWKLTLENGGKKQTIQGKTISELMQAITEKGLLAFQISSDKQRRN